MEKRIFNRNAGKDVPPANLKPRPADAPAFARPAAPRPPAAEASAGTQTAVAAPPRKAAAPTQEEITARAKAIWIAGGRLPGRDEQNWLEAERQLRAERGLK
jgi:hypothetical protein